MDNVEYDNCPYCHSKKVIKLESGMPTRITVKCDECKCVIDSYAKEKDNG